MSDPQWFKDAVIYELHVRAFHDSIGDGTGDFRGLTQKLDYLQDLGITAIWLLPFYPSPLRDDGYDIADYTSIHPKYGNMEMFREFLSAAHARGLKVITELVLNHTSDQHPWFQRARRAPAGSPERDFYVWSDSPEKYRDARIIFQDFEVSNWTYDRVAKAYFWHRFYSHQPDLNFDNPAVWEALFPIMDFWLEMGVDGMRLDAVPYLYEREGTICENLPETHTFLKAVRSHIEQKFPNRMLIAEANQWPEDAVAYFGDGDECHMCFHFPLMPRLFMAMHTQDRFPIVDILEQTPAIPDSCQWALFLRNHDELTLEMVTDEERDSMYRAYAHDRDARINLGIRRRLAPLLSNNRRRIELMNGLLFSLPGTPVLYYGDEIGMGDNIYLGDRNGVRTPMQWSGDRNAGFSRANPQKLYLPIIIDPEYHYEAINVEAQQSNPHSLLWWNKRLLGLRRQHQAFSRGTIEFLDPQNRKILAFVRKYQGETLLVVANLSRFVQYVELDLSSFEGIAPVELFGQTPFPQIGKLPYLLTLGPHTFYWFSLGSKTEAIAAGLPARVPELIVPASAISWEQIFAGAGDLALAGVLRTYLQRTIPQQKATRKIRATHLRDVLAIAPGMFHLAIMEMEFNEGDPESHAIPLGFAPLDVLDEWPATQLGRIVARLKGSPDSVQGVLYDTSEVPAFAQAVFDAIQSGRSVPGAFGGELVTSKLQSMPVDDSSLPPMIVTTEHFNHCYNFGNKWLLKVYRGVEAGPHPEVEIGTMLSEQGAPVSVAPLIASVEYKRRKAEPMTLGIVTQYVPHESDAWQYTLDCLSTFYERVATLPDPDATLRGSSFNPFAADRMLPEIAEELIGSYLENVRILGRRLGELHLALANTSERPAFAPLEFSPQYQRSLYQAMRTQALDVLYELSQQHSALPVELRPMAAQVIESEVAILACFHRLIDRKLPMLRTRVQGECHLGQVLHTGRDFVFIDLEGLPTQTIGERRIKRTPLSDVVGMLSSFASAAISTLYGLSTGRGRPQGTIRDEDRQRLGLWGRLWFNWVAGTFVPSYASTVAGVPILPTSEADRKLLLTSLMLDKWLSELELELQQRPDWTRIPLRGILATLDWAEAEAAVGPPPMKD
ncbi:Trehalose synthase/amylase TreS [Anatilimnocola aggregata]|uniref:maltose alpha-D-glucosyltransferase n=1 Tax=Anatilimnocola aggregata TaxID=2528021 RepID=A0A517YIT6_9BACT|nr:maltose alpha-D-glucosyltransferase [Anatilimnocola aggregata]QDU30124.1 Trehalose synthase/amylase TreS [Anatilimnocola aggregata]